MMSLAFVGIHHSIRFHNRKGQISVTLSSRKRSTGTPVFLDRSKKWINGGF